MAKTKKKLNQKVLFASLATVVVGCAVVFGVVHFRTRIDPVTLAADIDKAIAAKDFAVARRLTERGIGADRANPKWLLLYSDVVNHYSSNPNEGLRLRRSAIEEVLVADPKNEKGLERLVDFHLDLLSEARNPDYYKELKAATDRLLEVNPTHPRGLVAKARHMAETFALAGQKVDAMALAKVHDDLAKLRRDNPAEPEFIFYQAVAKQVEFALLMQESQANPATRPAQDGAVQNGAAPTATASRMSPAAAEVVNQIGQLTDELAYFGSTAPQLTSNVQSLSRSSELAAQALFYYAVVADREKQGASFERFGQLSDAVIQQLTRDVPNAYSIVSTQFSLNRRFGRIPQAQAASELGMKLFPEDWVPRISQADALAAQGKLKEAVEVLSVELPFSFDLVGVRGQFHAQRGVAATSERARYRDDLIQLAQPGSDRDALIAKQEEDIKALASVTGETNPSVIALRGGLQQAKRELNDAAQAFGRAVDLLPPSDDPRASELRRQYQRRHALLLLQLQQTGRAKQVLESVVSRFPTDFQARLLLADLYVRERDFTSARQQIEPILRIDPSNSAALRAMVLVTANDPSARKQALDKLPELEAAELESKLRLALQIGENEEATRLGEALAKLQPNELPAIQLLAQAYSQTGQTSRAIELMDQFIAANPDNENARLMRSSLAAQTPEDRQKLQDQLFERATPAMRLQLEAQQAAQKGDLPTTIAKFKELDALPNADGTGAERLLEIYVSQKDWTNAQAMVDRLTTLNRDQAGGRLYRVQLLLARAQAGTSADEMRSLRDQARDVAQEAVSRFPDFAGGHVALARVQQYSATLSSDTREVRELLTQASASFDRALDRQPNNALALRGAIETALSDTQTSRQAKTLIDRGVQLYPNDPFYSEVALQWETAYGDAAAAITARQKQAEQFPGNRNIWREYARAHEVAAARARNRLEMTEAQKLAANARGVYQKALEQFPQDIEFARNFAELSIGMNLADEGIARFEQVASLDQYKDDRNVLLVRADLLNRVNRASDAISLLQDALLSKNDPDIRVRLSQLMLAAGRTDSAISTLQQGIESPSVAQVLIETLTNLGRNADAKKLVDDALAKNRTPAMLNQAGYVALRGGDAAGALKFFDEVLAANPNDVAAVYFKALARQAIPGSSVEDVLKDYRAAKVAMEDARRQGRANVAMETEIRLRLARQLRASGSNEDAVAELEQALRAAPDDRNVVIELASTYAQQVPPRWAKVDEVLTVARQRPSLVNDLQLIFEQANAYAQQNQQARALASAREGLALAPTNPQVIAGFQQILLAVNAHREFIADSEKFPAEVLATWNVRAGRALSQFKLNNRDAGSRELDLAMQNLQTLTNPQDFRAGKYLLAQAVAPAMGFDAMSGRFQSDIAQDNAFRLLAASQALAEGKLDRATALVDMIVGDANSPAAERAQAHALIGAYALTGPKQDMAVSTTRYRQAVALNNQNIEYLNNLAYILSLSGEPGSLAEGLQHATAAYDLSAKASGFGKANPLIADTYGWLLVLNGRVPEGMKVLNEALAMQELPEILLHLAEGHIRLKEGVEAVRNLEKSLALMNRIAQNGGRVDQGLRARIDDARKRADELLAKTR
jgi:tetratricopeptide (TPR) repeat protein/KaiC/GvpD/RAD55 family RecA-like ATPase